MEDPLLKLTESNRLAVRYFLQNPVVEKDMLEKVRQKAVEAYNGIS